MLNSELDNIVEFRETLGDVIALLTSDEMQESQMADVADAGLERIINVFDESDYRGFSELFEFVYANWSEVDGYDTDCLAAIEDLIACCLSIFCNPSQQDQVGAIESILVDYEWLAPFSDDESNRVLSRISNEQAVLQRYQQANSAAFETEQAPDRKAKSGKKAKASNKAGSKPPAKTGNGIDADAVVATPTNGLAPASTSLDGNVDLATADSAVQVGNSPVIDDGNAIIDECVMVVDDAEPAVQGDAFAEEGLSATSKDETKAIDDGALTVAEDIGAGDDDDAAVQVDAFINQDSVITEADDAVVDDDHVTIDDDFATTEDDAPTTVADESTDDDNGLADDGADLQSISVKDLFVELKHEAENLDSDLLIQVESAEFTKKQNEILGIFVEELDEICEEFEADISHTDDINGVLERNVAIVQNMLDAAEVIEYEALSEILLIIYQTVELVGMSDDHSAAQKVVVWPWVLKEFLMSGITQQSINVVNVFIQRNVPDFSVQEVHELCLRLGQLNTEAFESDAEDRPTVAELSALSLAIPEDSNSALLESLINELPEQAIELTKSLGRFVEQNSFKDLDIARRVTHTIKGSGNTIGIIGLANFTHHLEDILDRLAKEQETPSPALIEVLQDATDHIEVMSEALLEGGTLPDTALQAYQHILDWANALDDDEVEIGQLLSVGSTDEAPSEPRQKVIEESPKEAASSPAGDGAAGKNITQNTMRVTQSIIDDLVRVAGENMISSGRIQEHVVSTKDSLQTLRKQQAQLNNIVLELEQLVFVRGVSSDHSVGKGDFDPLEMEQYNELHTATQRLLESSIDSLAMIDSSLDQTNDLESVVHDQVELQKENQNQVLQMRMVPVSSISSRFSRAVRQACRLTRKQVNFQLLGEDTQVDSSLLQQLVDPIMHILRNAIDHGIETFEERIAANKSEVGNVTLSFERVADQIIVRCYDDGAGFDHDRILQKAKEQNLIPASQEALTDEEVSRLVLVPGFSTKDNLTQVSGRGIGMDVVNQRIQEIKGNLKITSDAATGTDITVSLPVSLMSTHALLVDYEGRLIAISNRGIEDIVYLDENSIKEIGGRETLEWNTDVLNAYSLAELLEISVQEEVSNKIAIIVRLPDGSMKAITVPFIVDSRDLVLKALSKYLPRVNGVVGASILGDGSVTPVIDLAELENSDASRRTSTTSKSAAVPEKNTATKLPSVLVVDDSFSARRSLANFVEDLGYSVMQANDGLDAQEIIDDEGNHIVLVITDLEMPRMNGIDLTRQVKSHPQLGNTPVIMVTSRSTQKHVDLATKAGVDEYVTKPFDEDALAEMLNRLIH